MKVEINKWFSVDECRKYRNEKVYIFGDNLMRRGKGGQAIIRDEPNSYGITTKAKPYSSDESYLNDKMFEIIKCVIDLEIEVIKNLSKDKIIVFPKDGLGTGLAKLPEKAPKIFSYLCKRLKEEFDYENGNYILYRG